MFCFTGTGGPVKHSTSEQRWLLAQAVNIATSSAFVEHVRSASTAKQCYKQSELAQRPNR